MNHAKYIEMSSAYSDWKGGRRKNKQIRISKDEWIAWWMGTGVWDYRGNTHGCYFMSRIDKDLPFSIFNIELKLRK